MKKYVNLNTPSVKVVVRDILAHNWRVKFPLKAIKIYSKDDFTCIHGEDFLRFDRHHHYPDEKDWPVAIYLYLKTIDEVSRNCKCGMFIPHIPKKWRC